MENAVLMVAQEWQREYPQLFKDAYKYSDNSKNDEGGLFSGIAGAFNGLIGGITGGLASIVGTPDNPGLLVGSTKNPGLLNIGGGLVSSLGSEVLAPVLGGLFNQQAAPQQQSASTADLEKVVLAYRQLDAKHKKMLQTYAQMHAAYKQAKAIAEARIAQSGSSFADTILS